MKHFPRAGLRLAAGGALLAGSTLVQAGTTGHVGVFSEYVFRGVVANGGAAGQGGIDTPAPAACSRACGRAIPTPTADPSWMCTPATCTSSATR